MTILHRLWRGEVPLPQAFWNWAVFGGIAVNGLTSILFFTLLMNELTVAAFVVGYALSIPYNTFVTVAVWRSAARYDGDRRFADLARFVTLVGMTLLSVT
ncbi:MAG: hypothetical protein K9G60_07025 [Pseudolabrys sp.]|nr:hypothetical protein [Pseudolabrys sp.]